MQHFVEIIHKCCVDILGDLMTTVAYFCAGKIPDSFGCDVAPEKGPIKLSYLWVDFQNLPSNCAEKSGTQNWQIVLQ